MPIKAENKHRYPKDWPAIRERIRARAGNKCEQCGVANGAIGYRDDHGRFVEVTDPMAVEVADVVDGLRIIRIVLTIAHLDHTPEHCDDANLRALCQRCHLRYDAEQHQRNAAETRRQRKAVRDLFEGVQ